jgi:hypothetical protein
MQCEKCGSAAMAAAKRFRLSGCLVASGFALVVASLVALAVGLLFVAAAPKGVRNATAAHDARAMSSAIKALEDIPELPDAVARELESTGKVSEATIRRLPFDQQSRVRSTLIDYYGSRVASGTGGAIGAGVGVFLILLLFGFGVPGTIVGLLLVRKRKLWRCGACGFAFDRT